MERCKSCKMDFPDHLVTDMAIHDRYLRVCPICGLKIRNAMHDLPPETKFQGPVASAMYSEAVAYLNQKGA